MKVRTAFMASAVAAAISVALCPGFAQTASPRVATPLAATAPTAVPALVPYTGIAVGLNARPLTGETGITFLIFKDEEGGEPLFTETQTVVPDASGHYQVQLGATLPSGIPLDLFSAGAARWLEVQIAGQPAQPRILLASVPYALKAADATTLGGLPASAYALAGTRTAASAAVSPAITPDLVTNVTTTGGTAGYIPEFSGASTIVDSPVFVSGANVGIGTATPSQTLDVNGPTAFRGNANLFWKGAATPTAGANSESLSFSAEAYNSSTKALFRPYFSLLSEAAENNTASPSATLNLQFGNGTTLVETGLYINANGTFHFATGQTFPGAGTITRVTAGTALTGGGTTGNVTLNVDTTKVPLLATANTFTGTQTITGGDLNLPATSGTTVGVISIGGVPFLRGSSGADSVFVGGAGSSTTTGNYNTATGFDALTANTSGIANTADGTFSLIRETTATANTAIGYDSLYHVTSGSDNAGLGYGALFYNVTGSDDTAVGTSAGPDSGSTALSNSTAIGANAVVSQNNSLVLGQTTAGNPGNAFVNVGIGTAKPRSILEAVTNAPEALGPALTLTNSSANGDFGGSSIDFNTYLPSTTGTYNPSSRIEAFGDGGGGDSLWFLSNNDSSFGGPNQGLQLNMNIGSNGRVNIGTQDTDPNDFAEQLVVTSEPLQGNGEVAAIGAFGKAVSGAADSNGSNGVYASGGDGVGNAQADFAGDGGEFLGGFTPESSSGPAGYGIYAAGGVGGVGIESDAGYFDGNITVTGSISAGVKDFKIDHPLDPANKYLVHASVESSEMMNIYSGNVTTDDLGLATVTLPTWFQAENGDFRYQLTVLGGRFAQAIVSKEIADNKFTISTNATNVKVSWQVTAVRQDAYAKAHPMVVEQTKPAYERGFYEHPELYGQPMDKQSEWGRRPEAMQRMKAMREQQKLKTTQHAAPQLSYQPASAVNRNFTHPAAPAIQPPAAGTQLKPISQVETK